MKLDTQINESLIQKWTPLLESEQFAPIATNYKKHVVATLLENQTRAGAIDESTPTNLTGGVAKWEGVLAGMARRAVPSLIAFDVMGVQPMTQPSQLLFALRSMYTNHSGAEALFGEANTAFGGAGTHTLGGVYSRTVKATVTNGSAVVTVPSAAGLAVGMLVVGAGMPRGQKVQSISGTNVTMLHNATAAGTDVPLNFVAQAGTGMTVTQGEGDIAAQMGLKVEKINVEAKTRALKASFSLELMQDLQAVHGLNAEQELINILSNEYISEVNREVLRTIYAQARFGAAVDTQQVGVFDLQADADGRWSAERFKGLHFAIERDANGIAKDTRRGKANVLICSADVASALSMANILSTSNLDVSLTSDWTVNTYVGNIGNIRVHVDPYADQNFYCLGYKGASSWDAGAIFAPYVAMQLMKTTDTMSFQPILGVKARYGLTTNPFVSGQVRENDYYRIAEVKNII